MLKKRILSLFWLITMISIFIVTLVSHKPYFIMGGSTSVAPLMHTLMEDYPDNHKEADFTYNSLGSDAAVIPVNKNMFGIGWLSKEYTTPNNNLISFVLSKDGMILVYNLPQDWLGNNKPLNFTQDKVKKMYLSKSPIFWRDLFPQNTSEPNQGWIKPTCDLKILAYTRENGSGTRDVFNEKVLGDSKAYYPQAITVNSSTQMFNMSSGGVGYSSYSDKKQLDSNKQFTNIHIANWENIAPSLDTIKNGTYQLSRPFTGLINKNFKQINTLVKFLKFLFIPDYPGHNEYVVPAFSETQYAQSAVALTDKLNYDLNQWLNNFP